MSSISSQTGWHVPRLPPLQGHKWRQESEAQVALYSRQSARYPERQSFLWTLAALGHRSRAVPPGKQPLPVPPIARHLAQTQQERQ